MKPISSARVKSNPTCGALLDFKRRSNTASAAAAAARSSHAFVCSVSRVILALSSRHRAMSPSAIADVANFNRAVYTGKIESPFKRPVTVAVCRLSSASITSMETFLKYGSCTPPRNSNSRVSALTTRVTTNAGWSMCAVISNGRRLLLKARWAIKIFPPSSYVTSSLVARVAIHA